MKKMKRMKKMKKMKKMKTIKTMKTMKRMKTIKTMKTMKMMKKMKMMKLMKMMNMMKMIKMIYKTNTAGFFKKIETKNRVCSSHFVEKWELIVHILSPIVLLPLRMAHVTGLKESFLFQPMNCNRVCTVMGQRELTI